MKQPFDYAQRSLECCSREAMGYRVLGRALFFAQKYEQALQMLEQGIQVNPNYASCYHIKGVCSVALGLDVQAQQSLDIAERLNPFDPLQFSLQTARAISLVHQKRYDEAVELSVLATYYANAYFSTYAIASACLQLAGDLEKAQQYAAKALILKPNYSTELYQCLTPHTDAETRGLFINAMQRAGIPEFSVIH
jgi:tetratricopeptide (TPR) repeat protein